jgi:WD40 repeat protein
MSIVVRKPGFRIARSYEVAFSPGGDRLACIGVHVDVWDVQSRTRVARAHPFKHPSHIDFSPDGERLAVKSTGGEVAVLDAETLDVIARHDGRPWGEGADIRFSPCGDYLVDGSWRGVLLVRDALTGDVVYREDDEATVVHHVTSTPDRKLWAQAVWRYPPDNDVVVTTRPWPFSDDRFDFQGDRCDALALDSSGSLLAVVSDRLQVWSLGTSDGWPQLVGESGRLPVSGTGRAVAWASSDRPLVALSGAGATVVFTSEVREVWRTELEYSSSVSFSPSGELVALGAWSKGFVIATPAEPSRDLKAL